jgi:toxin ParE1/3/4
VKAVRFHDEAEAEFNAAVAHYEEIRSGLGLDLQKQVEHAVSLIQQNPHSFPRHNSKDLRKCVLKRFPYTIFYIEFKKYIWVVAVAHQKRRPGYWKKRVA